MVKKQQKGAIEFEAILSELGDDTPIPYTTDICCKTGDILDHKSFGVGKVKELITPNKMVVRFKDEERVMLCVIDSSQES